MDADCCLEMESCTYLHTLCTRRSWHVEEVKGKALPMGSPFVGCDFLDQWQLSTRGTEPGSLEQGLQEGFFAGS